MLLESSATADTACRCPSSSGFVEKSQKLLTRLSAQTEDLSVSVTLMFGPRGGGLQKGKVACHPRCPGIGTAGPVVPGMPDPSADLGAGLVGGTSGFPEFLPVDSDV